MLPTIDTLVEASVFLWLDNILLKEGSGFANFAGNFTKTTGSYGGFHSYASPFRQWVYSQDVSGAQIPSGVYANGVFQTTGVAKQLDFNQGQFISTATVTAPVSGSFSYKEVNLYFTNEPDEVVLFEKKYEPSRRHNPQYTSYLPTDQVYPLIFIKQSAGKNNMLCFDRMVDTSFNVRLIVLADTPYLYKSICGRIRDKKDSWLPIFNASEMPFNQFGALKFPFNYSNSVSSIQSDATRLAYITEVSISDLPSRVTTELHGFRIFAGIIDLTLSVYRQPS